MRGPARTGRRPVDLTLSISGRLPVFPGSPQVHTIPWQSHDLHGYGLELVAMSTHTGTHIDAPYHFDPAGATMDKIPISRLVRTSMLVRTRKRRGQNITAGQIEALERDTQKLGPETTIVFETGWSSRLDARYFERSPGLEPGAARLLARRRINMVGIDSPSIDPGDTESYPAHRALARSGTVIVENLCNLARVRTAEFELAVLPLKLARTSGAPARAVALC